MPFNNFSREVVRFAQVMLKTINLVSIFLRNSISHSIYIPGMPVSAEHLDEVAELSGVMAFGNDYLDPATRVDCERIIPDFDTVKPSDAKETYLFLKALFVPNTSSSGIS